ncbi:MAG: S8 family serine peptidase [Acidimicrobiia bacterium]
MREPGGRGRRLTVFLLAFGLVVSLVPVLPVAADPPDVTYSYDFSGVDDDPWETGWSFSSTGSEGPYIANNAGVMLAEFNGDTGVALRPESLSETLAEVTVVWDAQLRRRWGLALRHNGGDLGSESGYYCVLSNDNGTQQSPYTNLSLVRVSNGQHVELAATSSLSITADQRLKCEASGTTVRAKLWAEGTTEPGTWDLEVTDPTYVTGGTGIYFWGSSGSDVVVDDYDLEGTESIAPQSPDPGGGATFTETFTGDDNDPWPNDWTHYSTSGPKIRHNSGAFRGNGAVTSLLAGTHGDITQLARIIWLNDVDRTWGLAARHDGDYDGDQSAYYCTVTNGTTPVLEVIRHDSGTPTVLDDDNTINPETNLWLRCETEGNTIRAKVWEQGTEEPASWNIETTDSTYSSGLVGTYLGGVSNEPVLMDDYRLGPIIPLVPITATWSPGLIEETLATGSTDVRQLTLRVDGEIEQAEVKVSGDAAQVATVIQPSDPFPMSADVDYAFTVALSAESDLQEQTYAGSIQVVADGVTLNETVELQIVIAPPAQSVQDFAAPSSDRIMPSDVGPSYLESELMVGIDSEVSDPDTAIQQVAAGVGGIVVGGFAELRVYQVRVPATGTSALRQLAASMMSNPDVEIAGLHYVGQGLTAVPNDSGFDDWDEANPGGNNWALEYIKAPTGWDITTGDPSVSVAIVDNEIDLTHEDLAGNAGLYVGFRAGPSGQHGTRVAGVACAQGNNGIGMAGVAWDCDLNGIEFGFPVISAPDTVLTFNSPIEVASRLSVAAQIGARVTNLSFGLPFGECISDIIDPALAEQEVAVANFPFAQAIAGAQNAGDDVLWVLGAGNRDCDARFFSPSGLSLLFDNVITVGGIQESGELSLSASGPAVSVAAPMTNVLSTYSDFFFFQDDLILSDGTSFAAPQVTGLGALMLDVSPAATAEDLRNCIVSSSVESGHSVPGHAFHVIDVPGALDCISQPTAGPATNFDFETGDLTGWSIVDSGDVGTQSQVVSPGLDGTSHAFRLDSTGAPVDGIEQTVQRGIFNECGINLLVTGEAGTTIRVEILDASDSSLWASVEYTFDGSETEPVAFNSITGPTFSLPAIYTIRLLYVQRLFESASATFDEVELALCA